MHVKPMELAIQNKDRNVSDTAEVSEVLYHGGKPKNKEFSKDNLNESNHKKEEGSNKVLEHDINVRLRVLQRPIRRFCCKVFPRNSVHKKRKNK